MNVANRVAVVLSLCAAGCAAEQVERPCPAAPPCPACPKATRDTPARTADTTKASAPGNPTVHLDLRFQGDTSTPLTAQTITCQFTHELIHFWNKTRGEPPEASMVTPKQPLALTFIDLDGQHPRLKGNAGESPLIVVQNDPTTVVAIERNGAGNAFVYTIYRQLHVASYQKSWGIMASAFASQQLGTCY